MKLASYLRKNRLGIYYYRLQLPNGDGSYRELNTSLRTRNPVEAKALAYILSAKIKPFQTHRTGLSMAIDPKDFTADEVRKLLSIEPNGKITYTPDPNPQIRKSEEDVLLLLHRQLLASTPKPIDVVEQRFIEEKNSIAQMLEEQRLTIEQSINKYLSISKSNLSENTKRTYRTRLNMLQNALGDKDRQIATVTPFDVNRAYEKCVNSAPHNSKRHLKVEGKLDSKTLINMLNLWEDFFKFLKGSGYYNYDNPVSTIVRPAENKNSDINGATAFSDDELKRIFDQNNYKKNTNPYTFFVPLIALYTGARANEIASLPLSKIKNIDGSWCFEFKHDPASNVVLKNASSNRVIPIHEELVKAGLLEYIEDLKELGLDRLFPTLPLDAAKKRERKVSAEVNDYLKEIGIHEARTKTLHSFRDTCITKMADENVILEYRMYYVGHKQQSIHSQNYVKVKIPILKNKVLSKIKFDIDCSHIRYKKRMFDDFILTNKCD